MNTMALIPARAGSKEIPEKNFKDFCGKPLYRWAVDAAIESGVFNSIIVSTDYDLEDSVVRVEDRPAELSTDEASLDDLLLHYMNKYPEVELFCLLQPTSPLRIAEDITGAYKKICCKKYDTLVSVCQDPIMGWLDKACSAGPIALYKYEHRPNRQDRKDWYKENGAIYFTKKYALELMKCRLGGQICLYEMPAERSYEIDTEFDWKVAEFVYEEA